MCILQVLEASIEHHSGGSYKQGFQTIPSRWQLKIEQSKALSKALIWLARPYPCLRFLVSKYLPSPRKSLFITYLNPQAWIARFSCKCQTPLSTCLFTTLAFGRISSMCLKILTILNCFDSGKTQMAVCHKTNSAW